jgi:hypothetical protein
MTDDRPYWEKCRDRPDLYDVKVSPDGRHVDVSLKLAIPLNAVRRALGVEQPFQVKGPLPPIIPVGMQITKGKV